jgi:predicted dehydrogenase|tara:strand:+ start:2181 stop:3197 length:1017 start_codon:yes stop_codon:yes gene_type:complete
MKKNKKLYWAIIGSGDVVQRLVKNSFMYKNYSEPVIVISNNLNEAKLFSQKYNIKNYSNKITDIKKFSQINCAYIATPPYAHYKYIKILSNLKINLLCEKPLIMNNKELDSVKKLIKKNKINLVTCYYRRYLKRFKFIKKLLVQKKIGKILFFRTSLIHTPLSHPVAPIKKKTKLPWRFLKKFSGGGNFIDMGIHAIDMIDYLMGEIKDVKAYKSNQQNFYKVEDTMMISFLLKNGITGQGTWCSVADENEDKFEIYGSKGSVKFSMNKNSNVILKIGNNIYTKKITFEKPHHKNLIKDTVHFFIKNNPKKNFFYDKNGFKPSKVQFAVYKSTKNYNN